MQATIIGGGIIGLSTAYFLQQSGWTVTILDRSDGSDGCSFGNMGYLSPSHFAPLAQPGVIRQGFWWMFQQKSPFYVRPALSRDLIDWGMKFVRACTQEHVTRSAKPMAELLLLSRDLTAKWEKSGEITMQYAQKGCINYFQTAKYEQGELENVKMGRQLGLDIDLLDRAQCQALEPELLPEVRGGAWYKDDAVLYPNELMRQLALHLEKRGVRILRNTEVLDFQKDKGKITQVQYQTKGQENRQIAAPDLVVLAAGAWSPRIAQMAGENLSIMPGKGYSMTVDTDHQSLRHPCILLEAKVAITPWANQLRIGSTMEIGRMDDRILWPRVQGIMEAVPRFFPAYQQDATFQQLAQDLQNPQKREQKVWFGYRPLSADGLPYLGFAKKTENLMMATGHAMLGLSMAAASGKLVAEMANGEKTSIAVKAFAPGR